MHRERVDHHEDDAHQRREEHVDRDGNELLDVHAHLLQHSERLPAALILEGGIGQVERMAHAVRIELRAQPLRDDIDAVVLEVLRDPGHEGHADRRKQQQAHPPEELACRVFAVPRGVLVDHMAEDQRIQQRKHLVDGRQQERDREQAAVACEVRPQEAHVSGPSVRRYPPSSVQTPRPRARGSQRAA